MRNRLTLCLLVISMTLSAQIDSVVSNRITTSAQLVGVGGTNILDTYLSQEKFRGPGISFLSMVERQKTGHKWSTVMQHQAHFSFTRDRGRTAKELEGSYAFFWGKYYRWSLLGDKLLLQAGGLLNVGAGFIYNTVNSNNPAQARFHINIMPSAIATYRFLLGKRKCILRYEIDLPLVGIMFSPHYGQSYYEIFTRGNYDHNIVPTTMASEPYFRQLITFDINVSQKTTLRFGYLGDYQQAKVNGLRSHVYSHRAMIGIVRSFKITNYRP